MKKYLVSIFVVLLLNISFCQVDSLLSDYTITYGINGIDKEIIELKKESSNKTLLYDGVLTWINKTYDNPNTVIQSSIKNELIILQVMDGESICNVWGCSDYLYHFKIEFEKGLVRIEPISLEGKISGKLIDLFDGNIYYENGNLKTSSKHIPEGVSNLINKYTLFILNSIQ